MLGGLDHAEPWITFAALTGMGKEEVDLFETARPCLWIEEKDNWDYTEIPVDRVSFCGSVTMREKWDLRDCEDNVRPVHGRGKQNRGDQYDDEV